MVLFNTYMDDHLNRYNKQPVFQTKQSLKNKKKGDWTQILFSEVTNCFICFLFGGISSFMGYLMLKPSL